MISKCQLFEFCLFEDIVERVGTVNESVWDNYVVPGLAAILGGKFCGATAELTGGFCLGLHVRVIYIFLGLGFAHIDSVGGFHNEVRLLLLRSTRPIYVELIRHGTNPFEDIVVCFEYESEIKFG